MATNPQQNSDYKPVSCDLSDELEALSVKHRGVTLKYLGENGSEWITGHIADLYAKDHADYLKLDNGTVIRLDKIIEWREGT